ncbi:MAG TPA: hypothetical protein DEP84_14065, partial [Chloroflexi bacterium]|nr:hypothetical protein [Chloroflexota bacterium]
MNPAPLRLARLTIRDAEALWARLKADEPANIFAIADLEHFGWESPNLRFDGLFRDSRLIGHLMRYGTNSSFAYDDRDAIRMVQRWLRQKRIHYVNGMDCYVRPVLALLAPEEVPRAEESHLARLDAVHFQPAALDASPGRARRATLADLD